MKRILFLVTTATVAIVSLGTSPAYAKQKEIVRYAPQEIVKPYDPALQCLATQLSPKQKATTIGVLYFADRTDKETFGAESSAGAYLSGGMADPLIADLRTAGMSAMDVNGPFRELSEWTLARTPRVELDANGRPLLDAYGKTIPKQIKVATPDVVVQGGFTTMDFGSSSAKEFRVVGIGAGDRMYSLRYTVDARATAMPGNGNDWVGGLLLADVAYEKDVVGRENKAGLTGFFGDIFSAMYIDISVKSNQRELIQYSQRFMTARTAYGIVADLWKITACQQQLEYGDAFISGKLGSLNKASE